MALIRALTFRRKSSSLELPVARAMESASPVSREQDAIYQKGKLVARVLNPRVDLTAKEIHFDEIYNSDDLLLPDECEFQNYRIIVQSVGYASRAVPASGDKGRVLRDCKADLLGYSVQ